MSLEFVNDIVETINKVPPTQNAVLIACNAPTDHVISMIMQNAECCDNILQTAFKSSARTLSSLEPESVPLLYTDCRSGFVTRRLKIVLQAVMENRNVLTPQSTIIVNILNPPTGKKLLKKRRRYIRNRVVEPLEKIGFHLDAKRSNRHMFVLVRKNIPTVKIEQPLLEILPTLIEPIKEEQIEKKRTISSDIYLPPSKKICKSNI